MTKQTLAASAPPLTAEQLATFNEQGFVVLPPGTISQSMVERLRGLAQETFPSWESGANPAESERLDRQATFKIGNVGFSGSALTRRSFMFGFSPRHPGDQANFLWGRRAGLGTPHWPKPLVDHTENEELQAVARQALGAEQLSFHDGSLSCVYPGCTGEEMRLHTDTSGFTKAPLEAVAAGRFVLNMLLYVVDVDASLAPLRVIPGSHRRYAEVNAHYAKLIKADASANCLNNRGLYEEALPPSIGTAVPITGPAGTLVLMNSSLLHSATENRTPASRRMMVVVNFSNREHREFFKNYTAERETCAGMVAQFKDRALVERSFVEASQSNERVLKFHVSQIRSRLKGAAYQGLVAVPGRLYGLSKRRVVLPAMRLVNPPRGVNVGSGANWADPHVQGLDFRGGSDLAHNLAVDAPLPFADNSLEAVYSSHCLEHLIESDAAHLFNESMRCLKPGGVLRITCPDMDLYFDAYERRDVAWFAWVKDKSYYGQDSWLRLIVRHACDPVVDRFSDAELQRLYSELGRHGLMDRMCEELAKMDRGVLSQYPDGHKSWWIPAKLVKAVAASGFKETYASAPGQSRSPILRNPKRFDSNNPRMSLYVEAVK